MIKVVSFDIGGTLIDGPKNNYTLKDLSLLLNLDLDIVKSAYKNIYQKQVGTFEEQLEKFCKELKIQPNERINEFFKNKFEIESNGCVVDGIKEIFKTLKNNNYKIILFSNNTCFNKNLFDEEIHSYIDYIFNSCEMGYTKNDIESYKCIEKIMGYKSNKFLHVGDNLKSDYLDPIKNGWDALFYGNDDNAKSINDLNQIIEYLEEYNH